MPILWQIIILMFEKLLFFMTLSDSALLDSPSTRTHKHTHWPDNLSALAGLD